MTVMPAGATTDIGATTKAQGDGPVSHAAKRSMTDHLALRSDLDALLFLKRTLQFHSGDAERGVMYGKLRYLQKALDAQESALLSGPDSPGRDRIRDSLVRARSLLAAVLLDLDVPDEQSAVHGAETG